MSEPRLQTTPGDPGSGSLLDDRRRMTFSLVGGGSITLDELGDGRYDLAVISAEGPSAAAYVTTVELSGFYGSLHGVWRSRPRGHTTCPTCGTPVTVEGGDEGTCWYRPYTSVEPLRELARWIITGAELPILRSKMTLDTIVAKTREKLAESEDFDA